jgi:selenide,water dikinase
MLRLTQTVQKGGCAAKVAATELRKILSQVRFPEMDPNVLVDGALFDDAAIYKISNECALVQTLDFFTPIVDTPHTFGRVAAANALSDVYAMGGTPKTALAILAFPLATLDSAVAVEVLQGASDVLSEARCSLVGGHSIDDDTLKFGLSVTGMVHPEKIWSNAKAQGGDLLILTKPLGTGALTAGLKRSEFSESDISDALASMSQINSVLDLLTGSEADQIHAATDITGFGLLGHSMQMAKASGKNFELRFSNLPQFARAQECLEKGFLTKAHRTNSQYVESSVTLQGLKDWQKQLLFDPQTSGGLLLSVSPEQAQQLLRQLQKRFKFAAVVGEVQASSEAGEIGKVTVLT